MSVYIVSYQGEEWVDVLKLEDIASSIQFESTVYPRIVNLKGKFEYVKSVAQCSRQSCRQVDVVWEDNETNKKADIHAGTLTLTWDKAEDVMVTEPTLALWVGINGYKTYPVVTKIKGYDIFV